MAEPRVGTQRSVHDCSVVRLSTHTLLVVSSEPDSMTVIQGTYSQLDAWLNAVQNTFVPEVGSELRIDDADCPHSPLTQLAHQGLVASAQHLQAIRVHLDPAWAVVGNVFPMAHATLCRTALLGAAQAVWLLAPPDRSLRLSRQRKLLAYIQSNHRNSLKTLQEMAGDDPHEGTDQVAALLDSRIAALTAKRADLGETKVFTSTGMIKEAAHDAFWDRPDGAHLENAVLYVWQSGSGAAHGFIWQTLGKLGTTQAVGGEADGLASFNVSGSFQSLAEPYMTAYHLCSHGWRLLRRRGR